jgi:hypothetical protein
MRRAALALLLALVVAVVLTGCQGSGFIPYGDSDPAETVVLKTLGNVGVFSLYVLITAAMAAVTFAAAL